MVNADGIVDVSVQRSPYADVGNVVMVKEDTALSYGTLLYGVPYSNNNRCAGTNSMMWVNLCTRVYFGWISIHAGRARQMNPGISYKESITGFRDKCTLFQI